MSSNPPSAYSYKFVEAFPCAQINLRKVRERELATLGEKSTSSGIAEPYARWIWRQEPGGEGTTPVTTACSEAGISKSVRKQTQKTMILSHFQTIIPWLNYTITLSQLSYCHTIILSYYQTLILSYYRTIILSLYHTTILSYYHSIILSFCYSIILSYYHFIILSYSHTIIPSYYRSIIHHAIILLYYDTIILWYYRTIILSYYHTLILWYHHTIILSHIMLS